MNANLKYVQLYDILRQQILQEAYKFGQQLPTEFEMSDRYGVSRQTVRSALKKLETDGYISRKQGSGSYVSYHHVPSKRKKRIAVIATYISEYIFPSILRGIEEISSQNSCSIQISATNNSLLTERRVLSSILADPLDGIIAEGTKTTLPNPNLESYRKLADAGIPIVFFNSYYSELEHPNVKYVVTDDYAGSVQAVKMLIEKGHTMIGGIFKSDDIQGLKRFSGFIDGCIQYGACLDEKNIIWYTTESKHTFLIDDSSATNNVLGSCTAIVCYNDEIASQLITMIEEHKSAVKAIVSFDRNIKIHNNDIDFYSFEHPKAELGRIAMKKLLRMLEGEEESSSVLPWG